MKVLLVAKPWRGGLARYVHAALDEAVAPGGVEWLATYPSSGAELRSYRRDRSAWRRTLVQRIDDSRSDAVIFINHLTEFEELDSKENHVLWATDDPRPAFKRRLPYARVYIADPGYDEEARMSLGSRYAGVVHFACLPSVHRAVETTQNKHGFCFIGNRDGKRDPYLRQLCGAGQDLRVYGNYFLSHPLFWRFPSRFRPAIAIERMAQIYARHAASLNIHASVVRAGTNMRTFECAGYRVAQLVERLPFLDQLFEPGKEILTFDNAQELMSQMARIQREPRLRESLASRALRRVHAEHTYLHRVKQLLAGVIDVSPA